MNVIFKYLSLSGLAIVMIACNDSSAQKDENITEDSGKRRYEMTEIVSDTLAYDLELPGELKPYEKVTLHGKINGFVHNIKVDRGDEVEEGQLLMQIGAPEVQEKLLSAQAKKRELLERMGYSKQNYRRMKEASMTEGAVSEDELTEVESKFKADSAALHAAKAEVKEAKSMAEYTEITAPFDGVITKRLVSPGAFVGGGDKALLELSRQDKMRLEVAIPAKHSQSLPIESKAEFTVNSFPGKSFPVALSRSSKALNKEKRQMMVEFDYDNPDNKLNSGGYAHVNVSLKRNRPTLKVPSSSLIESKTEISIAKVVDGEVYLNQVITGLTHDGQVEVFGDIQEGDTIITKGNSTLKDGMEVVDEKKVEDSQE